MRTFKFDYYNQCYNISIENVGELSKLETIILNKPGQRWRLTHYMDNENNSYYSFGVFTPANLPGHGGEWSSRTEIINQIFNVDIIECYVVGQYCMAIAKSEVPLTDEMVWYNNEIVKLDKVAHLL